MDPILQTFLSWQFLIFGIAVVAVVFVVRKIAEYLLANWKPAAKESKLWNDLLMPIMPIIVGSICALAIKGYPYPNSLTSSGSRFIFGLGAGLLSTVLYRLVKVMITQKVNAALPAGTPPTQPSDDNAMSAGKDSVE